MTSTNFKIFAFYFVFAGLFYINYAKISKNTSFIATEEWQEIPEGMAIPSGLHVRINFETRKREVKLLNKSEEQENDKSAIILKDNIDPNTPTTPKKKLLLSDALKNLQKDGGNLKYSPENLSQIKRDFKDSEQRLTDTFDNMRQEFQSDAEIITSLIEEYLNITNPEQKNIKASHDIAKRQSNILDSFDYMLHQIDNSMIFISQGGLDILLPIVANETRVLRVKALRILGALTQNNPKAQSEVFKQKFPTYILKTLISSSNTEELSTALFAFGSLIRKFPLAQRNLLSTSGTQALVAIINRECELKVKVKAVTIISDIFEEQLHIFVESVDEETLAHYKELKLHEWLKANEFCEAVESAIVKEALQFFEQPDLVESFIEAVKNTLSVCKTTWQQNSQMQDALLAIRSQYILTADDYRNEIGERISELLLIMQSNRHEEL